MNTNGNAYTVIYTALIVVVVAGILAAAATFFKPMQQANIKAETISQMLQAAQFETEGLSNVQKLDMYAQNIQEAFAVNTRGEKVAELATGRDNIELIDNLKQENYALEGKISREACLPVYVFSNGTTVIPVYGAGLWGPVWGYVALDSADGCTVRGAYFDHESETAGLGARIKDDPAFRGQFPGECIDWEAAANHFSIVKGGATKGDLSDSAIDAITGATMTSAGLEKAINNWLAAYKPFFTAIKAAPAAEEE